jgi:hypothetical protein
MSTELLTLLVIAAPLVTPLLGYALQRRFKLRQDRCDRIQDFVAALRQSLPNIQRAVGYGYLYPSNVRQYRSILTKHNSTEVYTILPKKIKKQIDTTTCALEEFLQRFSEMRIGLYEFFRDMSNPVGGGGPNEIVVTQLVCMEPNEIPLTPTPVNFLQEISGVVSQARCTHDQMRDLWNMARDNLRASEFLNTRTKALEELQRLDNTSMKLQKL